MVVLDVREKEEFESEFIPDSICCPLSQFDLMAPGILKNIKESDVVIMCRSGNRARIALDEIKKIDANKHTFSVFEGGILAWKSQGKPIQGKGAVFPIMRQVQIVASTMIFLSFLLSALVSPNFIYLALFVGFGLALSGYTGLCPMVFLLQKMPWNNKKMNQVSKTNKASCCQ